MADSFFQPVSAMELARFAGIPTFMRLPSLDMGHDRISDVEVGLVGIPWDGGTTNRPGARHGPRQLRDFFHNDPSDETRWTGVAPFSLVQLRGSGRCRAQSG